VLERVIGNLVTNAVRHGAPPVRVAAHQNTSLLHARAHGGDLVYDPDAAGARFELVIPT
jgi:hypothetical protein